MQKYNPELDYDGVREKCGCVRDGMVDGMDDRLAVYLAEDPHTRFADNHRAPRWVNELIVTSMIPAGEAAHKACGIKWGP